MITIRLVSNIGQVYVLKVPNYFPYYILRDRALAGRLIHGGVLDVTPIEYSAAYNAQLLSMSLIKICFKEHVEFKRIKFTDYVP